MGGEQGNIAVRESDGGEGSDGGGEVGEECDEGACMSIGVTT